MLSEVPAGRALHVMDNHFSATVCLCKKAGARSSGLYIFIYYDINELIDHAKQSGGCGY